MRFQAQKFGFHQAFGDFVVSMREVVLATPEPPEAVLWALYSAEEIGKGSGHASFCFGSPFETTIPGIIIPISLSICHEGFDIVVGCRLMKLSYSHV